MLGRSSAFLVIVVLGQLFLQMLHPTWTQDVKLYTTVGPDHGLLLDLGLLGSGCYKYGRRCHEQEGLAWNGPAASAEAL